MHAFVVAAVRENETDATPDAVHFPGEVARRQPLRRHTAAVAVQSAASLPALRERGEHGAFYSGFYELNFRSECSPTQPSTRCLRGHCAITRGAQNSQRLEPLG